MKIIIFYVFLVNSFYGLHLQAHEQNFVNTQKQVLMDAVSRHCVGGAGPVKFGDKEFNINENIVGTDKFEKVQFHVFFGNLDDLNKDFEGVLELEYIEFQQPINDVVDQFAREFCFQMKQINFDLKEIKNLLQSAFEYALQDPEEYQEGVVSGYSPKQFRYVDLAKDQNTSAHQRREEITFQLGDILYEEEDIIIYGVNISDVKFDSIRLKLEKKMVESKPVVKFEILSSFYKIVHELNYMSKAYLIEKIIESFFIMKTEIFENLEMLNLTYVNERVDYKPEISALSNNMQNDISQKDREMTITYSILKDILSYVIAHDDIFDTQYQMLTNNQVKITQSKHIEDQCKIEVYIQVFIDQNNNQPYACNVSYDYHTNLWLNGTKINQKISNSQGLSMSSQFNYLGLAIVFLRNLIRQVSTTVYQLEESKSQKYYGEQVINPYADEILVGDKPVELVQAEMNQRLEPDIVRHYTSPIRMDMVLPYNYGKKTVKVVYRQVPELLKKMRKKKRLI